MESVKSQVKAELKKGLQLSELPFRLILDPKNNPILFWIKNCFQNLLMILFQYFSYDFYIQFK